MGKKIEREHLPYYHQMKKDFSKTGKCPSDEKFVEGISKAHLRENPNYYNILEKSKL